MATIPPFEADGLLPAGRLRSVVRRTSSVDSGRRAGRRGKVANLGFRLAAKLVDNLEILTRQLWQVGITEVFADGSFAEDKDHPNDIDGYFVCSFDLLGSGQLTRELNLLDPYKVWTWDPASRRPYRGYPKRQLPMWHKYRVELYPHVPGLGIGAASGTGTETSWNSLRRFGNRGATASREAS